MSKQNSLKLTLGIKNTPNGAQYPLHHVTYAPAKIDIANVQRFSEYDAKRGPVPSTSCDIHVCNCKFEVATSTSLGDTFTRTYIIKPLTLTFHSR